MRTTKTLLDAKARKAVLDGVNAIAVPVGKTFGPEGKNALLFRTFNRGSRITNDGVTVSECINPKNQFVRMAAEAFKEACKKTNEKVGDGTTGTAIIGGRLMNDVYNMLSSEASDFTAAAIGSKKGVITIRKMILESAEKVKQAIKDSAKEIKTLEDLEKVATVSVEDAELGKIIADMAWKVGVDGTIDVVEGYKGEIETEVIEGFRFPAKVAAKAFVNNPARYEMVATDCPVLITNYVMDNASEVAGVFQKLNAFTSKIIIVAPSFSENVLVNMVNATKGGYFMFPVKSPSLRTEQFEDLAIYCGATFFDKGKGKSLRTIQKEDLGFIEKLIVKDTEAREDATATGGKGTWQEMKEYFEDQEMEVKKGDKVVKEKKRVRKEKITTDIQERIDTLKSQVKETAEDKFKKLLERRIASMASSVGIIRVGDSTNASALYRKLKIEDAVYACKAALRGGYVKGGGLCLKEIADKLPEDDILKGALLAPYEQIQSSVDGGMIIGEDVIDPMEAIYYAVEHATSVVASLATVEIIVPEMEDPVHGEGEFAMAKMIGELNITAKRHFGQLKENEEEMLRDLYGGMTEDEMITLDRG